MVDDDLICPIHHVVLECMAGESAHPNNWYCPKCEAEKILRGQNFEKCPFHAEGCGMTEELARIRNQLKTLVMYHFDQLGIFRDLIKQVSVDNAELGCQLDEAQAEIKAIKLRYGLNDKEN